MKKTFTLLVIAALITSVSFAQQNRRHYDYGNNKDYEAVNNDWDGHHYGRERRMYYFSAREKNMQLFSINREYNMKIESVKHRFFMGRAKKEKLICSLELQRDAEIRSVIVKFNDRRNLFNARDRWHNDHDGKDKW